MTEQGVLGAKMVMGCNSPVPSDLLLVIIDLSKTDIRDTWNRAMPGNARVLRSFWAKNSIG